jgi:hypothetical protein
MRKERNKSIRSAKRKRNSWKLQIKSFSLFINRISFKSMVWKISCTNSSNRRPNCKNLWNCLRPLLKVFSKSQQHSKQRKRRRCTPRWRTTNRSRSSWWEASRRYMKMKKSITKWKKLFIRRISCSVLFSKNN